MSIYKPTLLDKFKDFVNGLKGNWDQYEDHVADFETAKGIITDTFDETRTYAVGDYAIYENVLYKCVEAIEEAGEWDADKWAATNIAEEFKSHQAEDASESNAGHIKLPEPWTNLTLNNGWVPVGNARVFKDPFGIVYLEIAASGGVATAGTVITNLPAKFCPDSTMLLRIHSGIISVEPDGRVRFSGTHSDVGFLVLNAVLRAGV